jgi:hypothetical protein
MAAGVYNLSVEQGVDLALEVAVQDSTGATYSLTGATAAAQIRDTFNGNLLATFASVTATGTTGVLTLTLNAATASALPISGGRWDLLLTTSAATKVRLLQGRSNHIGRGDRIMPITATVCGPASISVAVGTPIVIGGAGSGGVTTGTAVALAIALG